MRTGVLSATHDATQVRPPVPSPEAVALSQTGTTATGEKKNVKSLTVHAYIILIYIKAKKIKSVKENQERKNRNIDRVNFDKPTHISC